MKKRDRNILFTLANCFSDSFSIWQHSTGVALGSSDVIARRVDLMNKGFRGQIAFPYIEVTRMWQEKIVLGTNLYFKMNRNFLRTLPALTHSGVKDVSSSAKLLEGQLAGLSSMLKPYHHAVRSNQKRLRRKRG